MTKTHTIRRLSPRGRTVATTAALIATLASLGGASSALAKAPTGDFAVFSQCPRFTAEVNLCVYSQTLSGEVKLNKQAVAIEKTITLQGGIKQNSETFADTFVGALNGETLSKTAQKVPGGLLGLIKCNEITGGGLLEKLARGTCEAIFENKTTGVNAVTELARPASEIGISTDNLTNGEGVALKLPVKVHLENPLLGAACYVGSSASPLTLELTSGTTSPNPPNTPISGKVGKLSLKDEFEFAELVENTLVDNAFAAPEATGCGGIFAILINPLVNSKIGLPSPDGQNTAIQNNFIREGTAEGVIKSEK